MNISEKGLEFLTKREGKKNKVYLDSGGEPTIGVGHLLTRSERRSGKMIIDGEVIIYRNGLSDLQIMNLLQEDLEDVESVLNDDFYVEINLNQNQYDALCSFIFNVGISAFKGSTLLKKLNQELFDDIPAQLRRWVYDNGKKVQGLVNRREFEIKLWETGKYE